jgi:hypothetical protein
MNKKLRGQTKTKQDIKKDLFTKHPDLLIREFIDKSLNDDVDAINSGNTYYFSNNITMFQALSEDIDKLLCETIVSAINRLGYKKDKDYVIMSDYKIKTTPVVFIKTLSEYDYSTDMVSILKNVLIY